MLFSIVCCLVNNMERNTIVIVVAGGKDLEMVTIVAKCRENGIEVIDNGLSWGESSAKNADAVAQAMADGKKVLFIEPIFNAEYPRPAGSVVIDHHGELFSLPAAILQFCAYFGIEPTRDDLLIAANDSGYIPGMMAIGATPEEISEIRRQDRAAQGITPEQEAEAVRAISDAEIENGVTIVKMAHSKTATVADRLFSADKPQNLLVLSGDGEVNYFGNGALCAKLKDTFEGWNGGSGLGDPNGTGYWGGYPDHEAVLAFVVNYFA